MRSYHRTAGKPILILVPLIAISCALFLGLVLEIGVSAQTAPTATYLDRVTGVTFTGPAGLHQIQSRLGVAGRTTPAVFSTFSNPTDARTRVDISRELVVMFYVTNRDTGEDLRVWATKNTSGRITSIADIPRVGGVQVDGHFKGGARRYAFLPYGPDRVLVIDAFPATSPRIGILTGILNTMLVDVKK